MASTACAVRSSLCSRHIPIVRAIAPAARLLGSLALPSIYWFHVAIRFYGRGYGYLNRIRSPWPTCPPPRASVHQLAHHPRADERLARAGRSLNG